MTKKGVSGLDKLNMTTPIVELDGDEMTRILWKAIKEQLLEPFLDLKTEYYDLSLQNRNKTQDQVTMDAALAAKRLGVAVKCATITPNAQRMQEYPELKRMWPSPNATIRGLLDGTVFRSPITVDIIKPVVKTGSRPITVARHAYGDIYSAVELYTDTSGVCSLQFTGGDGNITALPVGQTDQGGVWLAMHNTEASIRSFAKSCFQYALHRKQDLWFSAKDTIAKQYDGLFKRVFEEEYDAHRDAFSRLGICYSYFLIDDAAAKVIRSQGGFIWACKNYDGDVMSDLISSAFGSLAMMTSVLVCPDGTMEFEAAHGTVTQHYYRYLKGQETSTNPIATIFAWSGGLRQRGVLDALPELQVFADDLEQACLDVLNEGILTGDLLALADPSLVARAATTNQFLSAIAGRLFHLRTEHGQ